MKKQFVMLGAGAIWAAGLALPMESNAAITVYHDKAEWEAALAVCDDGDSSYFIEDFEDGIVGPGMTVDTVNGVIKDNSGNSVWWDRVIDYDDYQDYADTAWIFPGGITAFGGNWDLTVNGPGTEILVCTDVICNSVGVIPNTLAGEFWGFVSDDPAHPFTEVILVPDGSGQETYELDDLVYQFACPIDKCCGDTDPMDLATESIVLIRDGEDRAQFKLRNVYDIKAAAYDAVDNVDEDGVTVQFGPCDDPICKLEIPASDLKVSYLNMRYTVGNVDVVRCIYGNPDKQECVINFRNDDFFEAHCGDNYRNDLEAYFPANGETKEMQVCMKVGGTTYSNTSSWVQQDSGSGGWTKYRYIPTP
jgi:hypothetical protein